MGLLTVFDGHRMAIVPKDTRAQAGRQVQGIDDLRDVLIAPANKELPRDKDKNPIEPKLHIAKSAEYGVIFATVLLVIIVVSNVPLRGLWSVIIILGILLLVLICSLWGIWDDIVRVISYLDIRINAGGYFFISLALLIIWAVTVFVFDHRTYVTVTSGQVRVCLAIGAGETVYDTTGMTFTKRQDDLFRHWIIGLGSGDLIIHRSNTTQEIDMPNVLFVGSKIKEIERLIKEREVV
jgi:FlaA1/EpsC-like NDP-sugar epimerase